MVPIQRSGIWFVAVSYRGLARRLRFTLRRLRFDFEQRLQEFNFGENLMSVENENIEFLIKQLEGSDGVARQDAREKLTEIGGAEVTQALVILLNDHRRDVRWEAAKALIAIRDPSTASALTHHLSDEDSDIRWLAAEGLGELGEAGLLASLNAAIRYARDKEFCRAVRHTFLDFKKRRVHPELLDPLVEACNSSDHGAHLPVAAFKVLEQIREK